MAEYLVIVESPAKAKTIGKFLGKSYKIQASMGHVRDLPKSQMGVDIEHDFTPKYITIRGKGDLISKLRKEAKKADKIFLATDPDREGEAISWHLANLLKLDENEPCRISFNEITKNAVKNAIKEPRKINMDLVDAQQARRVLDRIVGYKISPLLWKNVRRGLSAGRVQSVATRLICDREKEIQEFVSEEYWSLLANLSKGNKKSSFEAKFHGSKEKKIEIKNEEQVNKIVKKLNGSEFKVVKVKKGEKSRAPAPPFTTSTLQQEASRKLGFTTKKTMMLAQQLYEGIEVKGHGAVGLVTYIRTDSVRISNDAAQEARKFVEAKFGKEYLPDKVRSFKNKSASQDAHEAIRPTYVEFEPIAIKDSLSRDQFKLYKLIWERFMASQMASAIYNTLTVDIEASDYVFRASGSSIKFQGFMACYVESKEEEVNEEQEEKENLNIPDLNEGDVLKLEKLIPKQHFTQPPPRYTEASLVKALEEKGIGRPSTYAPTITTILARGYVEKQQKMLVPTELGMVVTELMKKHFRNIVDVGFTAEMEKMLDDVEEGKKRWVEVMMDFYGDFDLVLKKAEETIGKVELKEEVTDVICEKCGRNMVIKYGRYGKFLGCPGYPECKNSKPIREETGVLCPKCKGMVLVKKSKKGRKYYGCENNPQCDFMTWDTVTNEICPKCSNFLLKKIVKKKMKLKCSNEKCDYEADFVKKKTNKEAKDEVLINN